jgi:hypothetical protein
METENTDELTFTKQDDENEKKVDDTYKYTKIDTLDEDPPFQPENGTCYVAISFVSPEGLMNCKIRGFKVRGFFFAKNDEEANEKGKEFNKQLKIKDKYFDVFVAPAGKWCPWDPDPLDKKYVHEAVYDNKKLNTMMKSVNERNMNDLNELVGRKKEQLDKSKEAHQQRVADTIKDNATGTISHDVTPEKKKHDQNDVNELRSRMRRKLEEKKLKETENELRSKPLEPNVSDKQEDKTTENINKMKTMLEKYKKEKEDKK